MANPAFPCFSATDLAYLVVSKSSQILPLYSFLLLLLFGGYLCTNTDAVRKNAPSGTTGDPRSVGLASADSSATITPEKSADTLLASQVTTIQANISHIVATVKGVVILDTVDYRITVHVDSSSAIGGLANFAEPGADITLSPRYFAAADGTVDITNDRNKRLYSLRSLQTGASVRGKVVRQPNGNWEIADLDQ